MSFIMRGKKAQLKPDAVGRSDRQGLHSLFKPYLICFAIKYNKTLKNQETIALIYHIPNVRVSGSQKKQRSRCIDKQGKSMIALIEKTAIMSDKSTY